MLRKYEFSPTLLNARAVRFSEPRRGYAFVARECLSNFGSVLGQQQRHEMIDRCRYVAAGEEPRSKVNCKPKYHLLKQTYGTDKRLCNSPIRLSVIGSSSTALCRSNWDCGGEMLSKEYLDTARTILRVAQTMTDQYVVDKLKALAEDYERRAEKAAHADAAKTMARSSAREYEALS
jgi:hypothetical protein